MKECCVVLIIGNKTNQRELMLSTPITKLKEGLTIKELTEYVESLNKIANPLGGYVKLGLKMFPSELANQVKYINKVEVM